MSNYILGIDGGGTKTLGVLWDQNGNELKRVVEGFANFNVDDKTTRKNIETVIEKSINDLKGTVNVYMGLSGVSGLKDKDLYIKDLKSKFPLNDIFIESDAYLGLYSVRNNDNKPVIMVIGGTGSIAYILNNNNVTRLGGYGHLLGDEGSAYHLVIESFKYMINDYETNNKLSSFTTNLLKLLNIQTVDDIKGLVYNVSKDSIAKYAKHISSLASDGDEVAIKLLKDEGKLLASLVIKAYKRLNTSKEVIVAIRGGFVLGAPLVKDTFLEELNNKVNYIIDDSNFEPVVGALKLDELKQSNQLGKYNK